MDDYAKFCAAELTGLTHFAAALTGDRQSAHDLLADSLVQAQLHWDRVSDATNPLAYVRRMITNNFISHHRTWSFRQIRLTRTGSLPDVGIEAGTGAVDDRAQLESMVRQLPRQQRAAVVLRYYLDLPDDSIAAILKCSPATVRSHISHALVTLRIAAKHSAEEKR